MKSALPLSLVASTLTALAFATASSLPAQEKPIERSALPPAVEKTIATQQQGATIKRLLTEREYGKRVYEAEMIVDGHTKDIQIAEDGTLNEIEEEVAFSSLPLSVQASLYAKTKPHGARITKVESLTKHGKIVAYDAATLTGSKQGEIQVGPAGKKLAHEE